MRAKGTFPEGTNTQAAVESATDDDGFIEGEVIGNPWLDEEETGRRA